MHSKIDITFDFRTDTPPGKDPDVLSPTLRRYHKLLWSKPLPNGVAFTLDNTSPKVYLHHHSDVGEFLLSSDGAIPTFTRRRRMAHIVNQIPPEEREAFIALAYTIGGMMVFPGNQIDRKLTINCARGFHPQISDRFDLTVECIRRHYLGLTSPLSETLERYTDFFRLFKDFRGYIEFFLLQDIVTNDFTAVKFFKPFEGFDVSPLPATKEEYILYKKLAIEFIMTRNSRIALSVQD